MSDTLTPIPPTWRENFGLAADKLHTWPLTWQPDRSQEPILTIEGEPFTIGDVYNRVMTEYSGEAPEVFENVLDMAVQFQCSDEAPGYTCEVPRDQSCTTVARCLLRLYEARKAHFKDKE